MQARKKKKKKKADIRKKKKKTPLKRQGCGSGNMRDGSFGCASRIAKQQRIVPVAVFIDCFNSKDYVDTSKQAFFFGHNWE